MSAPAAACDEALRGDFSLALRVLTAQAGMTLNPSPDFKPRCRDPRQDMQYGESLQLCLDARPYRSARRALARLRRGRASSAGLWLLSGVVEAFIAGFPAAERYLSRAIALKPRSPWAYAWRGVARSLRCRQKKSQRGLWAALVDLDEAVKLGGDVSFIYPWRAELRHDLEDMRGALEDLDELLSRGDESIWARVEKGEILCELGEHQRALGEFDLLVKENPRTAWAYAMRGRTLATTGRTELSLRDLRRAVALDPRSAPAQAWLAESMRKMGRYREALRRLDLAIACDRRYTLAWVWKGRILLLSGRFAQAARALDAAIRIDPRYLLAYAWRGEARYKMGQAASAARDFKRIRPMEPATTWNPVLREGEILTARARRDAYLDDMSRARGLTFFGGKATLALR